MGGVARAHVQRIEDVRRGKETDYGVTAKENRLVGLIVNPPKHSEISKPLTTNPPARFAPRLGLFLIGLMWTLPFLQPRHFYPLPLFYSEWLALFLGLAALCVLLLPRSAKELDLPWIALTPLALIGILLLHLVLLKAAYPQQIVLAMLYLLWAAGLILLGSQLRRETGLAAMSAALAWFVVAGGLLSALAGILQHFEIRGFLEPVIATKIGARAYGNLVQANHFADYISLALASLSFLCARGRIPVVVAGLLSCLLLFVLSLGGSASAWLYLVAIAALAALLYVRDKQADHRRLLIFSILLLPGFALAQWLAQLSWGAPPALFITPTERLFDQVNGIGPRLQLWGDAWLMFLRSPLLGVGFGQFAWQHFLLAATLDSPPLAAHANHAHNIFLHLLAETGLLGAVTLLVGVGIWLWGLRRLTLGLDSWWLLAMLAVLGIHSMLEYPLWYAYFLGVASILLGAGDSRFIRLKAQRAARAGFAVLMAVGWISAFSLLRNYYVLEVSLFPRSNTASKAELDRAYRDLMSVHGSLLTPYVELAFARAFDLDRQNLEQKIEFSGRVMRFAPTAVIAYQHAALLALNGDQSQAVRYLDHAVAAYPERLGEFAAEFAGIRGRNSAALGPFHDRLRKHLEAQRSATFSK